MAIIYDPAKIIKNIAEETNVPVTTVRSIFQRNGCHYMEDCADYLKKEICLYLEKYPKTTVKEIASIFDISSNTVRKYVALNLIQGIRR